MSDKQPKSSSTTRTKLPEVEVGICRRLRMLRESLGMSQSEFAARIGVTRNVLANYEWERVPLKWHSGQIICTQYNVDPHWLATGLGEMRDAERSSRLANCMIPTNWNFSKALPLVTHNPTIRLLSNAAEELGSLVQFAALNFGPEDLRELAGLWQQALASLRNAELSEPGGPAVSESTERVATPGFAPVIGSGAVSGALKINAKYC